MKEKSCVLCPLPWVSTCVQPYGPALCCSSYVDLRTDANETPAQVYQGSTMKEIREQFLRNEWPSQCRTCEVNEKANVLSLRQQTIRSGAYDDIARLHQEKRLTPDPLPIRFLELASSNFCNLKCRMCGPRYSTKWNEDMPALKEKGFGSSVETVAGYDDRPMKDFGAQELSLLLADEPFIMMKGGEPMLNKNNAEIIAVLEKSEKIHKTKLSITTNGVFLAEWFLKNLAKFAEVNITFSIDASGPLNKYIRYGQYENEDLKINMEKIRTLRPDTTIVVSTAFQIYNMLDYPDLVHEYSAFCDHFAVTPAMNYQLNAQFAPDELRELSLAKIKVLIKKEKVKTVRQTFEDIHNYLSLGKYNADAWSHFVRFTQALDEIRDEKLADVAPEISRFIDA